MASIVKRDGKWRARLRDPSGTEHCRHFERKVDATKWVAEQSAGLVTGQWIDPRDGKITFQQFAEQWRSSRVERPGTAKVVASVLHTHAYPAFGGRQLSSIRPSDIQHMIAGMTRDGLAPRTVHRAYAFVAGVFKSAAADRVIASTPCRGITLPRIDDAEIQPPTAETVAALADAIEPHLRPLVFFLAGSGLRINEALAVRIGDLDWLRRSVRVSRQASRDGSDAPPKSAKSTRTVALGSVVIDTLAAYLRGHDNDPAARLFPVTYRAWSTAWNAAREAIGEPTLRTHDLRHFFASALISGGASVKQVQAACGHASPLVTLKTYAHLFPGDEDRTRAILDAALDGLRTPRGLSDQENGITAGQAGNAWQ
jgi:integrase